MEFDYSISLCDGLNEQQKFIRNVLDAQAYLGRYSSFTLKEATDYIIPHKDNFIRLFVLKSNAKFNYGINRFQIAYHIPGEHLVRASGFTWNPKTGKLCVFPDDICPYKRGWYGAFDTPTTAMIHIIKLNFQGSDLFSKYKLMYAKRSTYGLPLYDMATIPLDVFDMCNMFVYFLSGRPMGSIMFNSSIVIPMTDQVIEEKSGNNTLIPEEFARQKGYVFRFYIGTIGYFLYWDTKNLFSISSKLPFELSPGFDSGPDSLFNLIHNAVKWSNYAIKGQSLVCPENKDQLNLYIETAMPSYYKPSYRKKFGDWTDGAYLFDPCNKHSVKKHFPLHVSLVYHRDSILWEWFMRPEIDDKFKKKFMESSPLEYSHMLDYILDQGITLHMTRVNYNKMIASPTKLFSDKFKDVPRYFFKIEE